MKQIIVNADDFGLTDTCTEAIVTAFDKGLITDTTMIANSEAYNKAIDFATGKLDGFIGIHFNLTEGTPLTDNIKNLDEFCTDGLFHAQINRYKPLSASAKTAVYNELTAQIKRLIGDGVNLTHADSHHHIHTAPFIAPIAFQVCRENGITAVRLHRNIGDISKLRLTMKNAFNKNLKKQFHSTDYFGRMVDAGTHLPDGITEIMVHPDFDIDNRLIDRLGTEREGCALEQIKDITEKGIALTYKEIIRQ